MQYLPKDILRAIRHSSEILFTVARTRFFTFHAFHVARRFCVNKKVRQKNTTPKYHSIHELALLIRVPFVPMPFAYKPIYFAMLSKTLYIAKRCSLNSNWRESNFAKLLDRDRRRLIDFKKKERSLQQSRVANNE